MVSVESIQRSVAVEVDEADGGRAMRDESRPCGAAPQQSRRECSKSLFHLSKDNCGIKPSSVPGRYRRFGRLLRPHYGHDDQWCRPQKAGTEGESVTERPLTELAIRSIGRTPFSRLVASRTGSSGFGGHTFYCGNQTRNIRHRHHFFHHVDLLHDVGFGIRRAATRFIAQSLRTET